MTLGEMTTEGQDLLGETEGTAGAASPFAWKRNLLAAADTVARATHAMYRTYSLDLAAGQSDYCAPPLYHIVAASVLGPDGTPYLLRAVKNAAYVPRDAAPFYTPGAPAAFAALGANLVRLYDTPGYSTAGAVAATPPAVQSPYGLALEGFGVCGDLWDAPGDECPLPARGHRAALFLAVSQRAAQMKDFDTSQYYQAQRMSEQGYLEAEAATLTRPQSGRPGSLSLAALSGPWAGAPGVFP